MYPEPDALLENLGWLKALARSLVRDEARADDVVQETCLAALRSPHIVPSASWLRRVLRNFAYRLARGERRQLDRERGAARREIDPTTTETILERAELHRQIVGMVLELSEPYRSTVLLRYFEDLSPAAIARRQGVPVTTVRSRLARALERLRRRLDSRHGDRGQWCAMLFPALEPVGAAASSSLALQGATTAAASAGGAATAKTGMWITMGVSLMSKNVVVASGILSATAVGLGLFVGVIFTGGDGADPSVPGTSPEGPREIVLESSVSDAETIGTSGSEDPDPSAVVERPDDGVRRHLAMALGAMPAPAIPRGNGIIDGFVHTERGEAVAGILVRATWQEGGGIPSERLAPRRAEIDLVGEVSEFARERHHGAHARTEAVTDAAGYYAIEGLDESSMYILAAFGDGMEVRPTITAKNYVRPAGWDPLERVDARPGDVVDFLARPVVEVPILVEFVDGGTPETAKIFCKPSQLDDDHWTLQLWYPESPLIRLNEGTYDLRARVGIDHALKSEDYRLALVSGERVPLLKMIVEERSGVAGRVLFPEGEIPDKVYVAILRMRDGQSIDAENLWRLGSSWKATREKAFGYRFSDLAPGRYFVAASRYRGEILTSAEVDVAEGTVPLDLTMPALAAGAFVTVRIVDAAGNPLNDNPEIRMGYRSSRGAVSGSDTALKDGRSTYRVPYPRVDPSESVEGVEYFIKVISPLFGEEERSFPAGTGEVVVRFEDPAFLDVTVGAYRQSDLEGSLAVWLFSADRGGVPAAGTRHPFALGGARVQWGSKLGSDGTQRFSSLAPGEYDVATAVRGSDGAWRIADVRSLTLASGENRVVLPLPPVYTLAVTTRAEDAGEYLYLSPVRGGTGGGSARIDDAGRAVFDFMPGGDYVLSTAKRGERMPIRLDRSLEVVFEPPVATPPETESAPR